MIEYCSNCKYILSGGLEELLSNPNRELNCCPNCNVNFKEIPYSVNNDLSSIHNNIKLSIVCNTCHKKAGYNIGGGHGFGMLQFFFNSLGYCKTCKKLELIKSSYESEKIKISHIKLLKQATEIQNEIDMLGIDYKIDINILGLEQYYILENKFKDNKIFSDSTFESKKLELWGKFENFGYEIVSGKSNYDNICKKCNSQLEEIELYKNKNNGEIWLFCGKTLNDRIFPQCDKCHSEDLKITISGSWMT